MLTLKRGDKVNFESGGVAAIGIVEDFIDGLVFVYADRLVPVSLGRGTPLETIIQHNRLWLTVEPGRVIRDRDGVRAGITTVRKTC